MATMASQQASQDKASQDQAARPNASHEIPLDLSAPGTIPFTPALALQGHRLNQFALTLKFPENRDAFKADRAAYMRKHRLDPKATALIEARDWTGLLQIGGHVQTLQFIAVCFGESLWHIGAHNAGMTAAEMQAACPRHVSGMPDALRSRIEG